MAKSKSETDVEDGNGDPLSGIVRLCIAGMLVAGMMGTTAVAQEEDLQDGSAETETASGDGEGDAQFADYELWSEGGCFSCHGNMADGGGDAANAVGPSLRRSFLDHDELVEVISCGRPGTAMPMFLEGAWTEHACYDEETVAEVPSDVANTAQFSAEQIESLVGFLEDHVVGETRVTRENCAEFFGGDESARTCLQY